MKRLWPAALILPVALAGSAAPQGMTQYERLYGTPVDVALTDLINGGMFYTNRAVRTRGRLGSSALGLRSVARSNWVIEDAFGGKLSISPVAEISQTFEEEGRRLLGREVRLTGVLEETTPTARDPTTTYVFSFWSFDLPPDRSQERIEKAKRLSIAELASTPGRYDGELVRVAGSFRGCNLFNDLPLVSQRDRADWVLWDEGQAIWVTGKRPKGSGWDLDPTLRRDTGKWIEVLGKPRTNEGITTVKAERVVLVSAPVRLPTPEATADLPALPKLPPVVVFALPLDGETDAPREGPFFVQFSKDMDEASFKGHVQLRYAGPPRPGVRALDAMSFTYDAGRRALRVDPGDRLRRGLEVELRLLPGIKDVDGLELLPRGAESPAGSAEAGQGPDDEASVDAPAVDVFHYRVGE